MKTSSVAMLKTALTITRKLGVERQIEDEHGAVRAERIGPLGLGELELFVRHLSGGHLTRPPITQVRG